MAEVQSGFSAEARPFPQKLYQNKALHGRLAATIAAGRLCHAYLFYGESGLGKRTFAQYLAATILCRGAEKPCGRCASCVKAFSGSHPDIVTYEGKHGANAFHIEAVREIRQNAYVLPNESEYKVYVLPNVEDMTPGAANAFLKVLEEPPAHVVFLLTADNPERVMETIRSRCILQELYPMPDDELEAALGELFPGADPEIRHMAAEAAGGVLGRAANVLESADYQEVSGLADRLAAGLAARNEYEVLAAVNGANQTKERMLLLLTCASQRLRSALLERLSRQCTDGLGYRLTEGQLEQAYAALEAARAAVNGNANLGLLTNELTLALLSAAGLSG